MTGLLDRILRRSEPHPAVGLIPFGHRYDLSGDRLRIEAGPLAGTALRVERRLSRTKADFGFYDPNNGHHTRGTRRLPSTDPIAHVHIDRNPESGTETLWSIFIRSGYRHCGLTTLLTRVTFRELLHSGRRHWFAIRKMMQVDTGGRNQSQAPGATKPDNPQSPRISLHNLGLGLVAVRLGFRPAPDLERLLAPDNVKAIQAIPPDPPNAPGLLLRLDTEPGLLVAALVDSETGKPPSDAETYERFVSPRQLLRQALAGDAVIGNIDYILSRAAIEPFAARMADDHAELRHFTSTLRRGAQS
jgi:hypothetical protein